MTRGVLFDVDGTLVDSTYIHAVSWRQALRQAGFDVLTCSIHRAVGMGSERLVPQVLGADVHADVDASSAAHAAIYSTWWPTLRALPRAADLLRSAADCDATKPAPELVEVALGKAGLAPTDAIFVGDSVWDVHAANAAGVSCIGLECGGSSEAALARPEPSKCSATPPSSLIDGTTAVCTSRHVPVEKRPQLRVLVGARMSWTSARKELFVVSRHKAPRRIRGVHSGCACSVGAIAFSSQSFPWRGSTSAWTS